MKRQLGRVLVWILFDLPLPKLLVLLAAIRLAQVWEDEVDSVGGVDEARFTAVVDYYAGRDS